jgi:hypothetical protein
MHLFIAVGKSDAVKHVYSANVLIHQDWWFTGAATNEKMFHSGIQQSSNLLVVAY